MRTLTKTLQFPVTVTFRPAQASDVDGLEWHGLFTEHRAIILEAFQRQLAGENVMLLAISREQPVGQCWIDLTRRGDGETGVLWALRVVPWLQGYGIGKALVEEAEADLRRRNFKRAELHVDKWNSQVIPFYERLGYRRVGETTEHNSFRTPSGELRHVDSEQWVYRKELEIPKEILSRATRSVKLKSSGRPSRKSRNEQTDDVTTVTS